MKWDGEWHITYEVFRDLGLAFAAVLVLIYILVVGWFQSFKTPLTIMAAIPFSLIGILPAHALMGAFFTATSMIGFIAGAGIVVRNSIILVDFVELRLNQGMALADAVVDAGAVRFRPMMLTAAAVIAGSAVILFDPIFQGLAISLMAGEVASLLLSRMTVPVLFYMSERKKYEQPPVKLPVPPPESPEETEVASVESQAVFAESVPGVESPADTEIVTGNEQPPEGARDQTLKTSQTANCTDGERNAMRRDTSDKNITFEEPKVTGNQNEDQKVGLNG
jgi:predicted RND superfamily exporter protein